MKKYILLVVIVIIPLLGISQSLVPDAFWNDGNHRPWCDKGLGTTFLTYNGVLHVFNYQGNGNTNGGHTYMYTINAGNKTTQGDLDDVKLEDYKVGPEGNHNNKLEFGYYAESLAPDEGPVVGKTFTFLFDGRAWYFMHVLSGYYNSKIDPLDESYECFAQLPEDDSFKCYTYYKKHNPSSQHWKQGGFQLDSLMYFMVYKNDDKYWEIDEHYFSEDDNKFQSAGNDFKVDPYIESVGTHLGSFPYFGGMVRRIDALGNQYLVVTFYNQTGFYVMGKIVPGIVDGKRSFTWEEVLAEPDPVITVPNLPGPRAFPFYVGATTLAEGSFKGNRTANNIPNKEESDRLVLFGESSSKSSDGYYHVAYCEYHFENDLLVKDASGEIALPSSRGPYAVTDAVDHEPDFHLQASFQLKPMDYTTMLTGTDGYQSYMWLIYPDHDRHFNGAMFMSDCWRQDPDLFEESSDLADEDSYPGIRDLWSLVGIIDGAPPVSMDWEKWLDYHGFHVPASSLEFETETSGTTEILTSTEHEWSLGQSLKISVSNKSVKAQMGEKFKYSETYENTVSHSETTSVSFGIPYELEEESQDFGFYIYSVPVIKRYTYFAYPWWDNNTLQYPVESAMQYLFVTVNNPIISKAVTLDKYPFYVDEPNDSTMRGWHEADGRSFVNDQVNLYDLFPVMYLHWDDGSGGSWTDISTTVEDITSNSQTRSWDFEVEAGGGVTVKIPKICKVESEAMIQAGYSGSLLNETTTTSELGNRIRASLENLKYAEMGINLTSLAMNGYLFTQETNPHWWYFDSLAGQRPFYLAWVVSTATQSLELQSPANGSYLNPDDLLFTWMPDRGELHDYKLFISKSSNISSYNSVYQKQLGRSTALSVKDFQPEPGETYFWAVRAYDENGEAVYSPKWSFTITDGKEESTEVLMKAAVYPNPASGSDFNIAFDPVTGGRITVQLVDISGSVMANAQVNALAGTTSIITFPGLDLPAGIYLAVIRSDNEQVVKKIVVR